MKWVEIESVVTQLQDVIFKIQIQIQSQTTCLYLSHKLQSKEVVTTSKMSQRVSFFLGPISCESWEVYIQEVSTAVHK